MCHCCKAASRKKDKIEQKLVISLNAFYLNILRQIRSCKNLISSCMQLLMKLPSLSVSKRRKQTQTPECAPHSPRGLRARIRRFILHPFCKVKRSTEHNAP